MIGIDFYDTRRTAKFGIKMARHAKTPGLITVFEAVLAGRIAVCVVKSRAASFPLESLAELPTPALAIILDSNGGPSGPAGWSCAATAFSWSATVWPNSTHAAPKFFQLIVEETVLHRRFLLIETIPETVSAWRRAAGGTPVPLAEAVYGAPR